jgi:hypothetical protein
MMRNFYASNSAGAIPYRKEYKICFTPFEPLPGQKQPRELTTSGAILLQQLDYWFARYPKGFYKFIEPPKTPHRAYKDGDSWQEELAFSRREFTTAFDQIGIAYKSKKQFDQAKQSGDVFRGRFYCCYFDRINRVMWYYRNHAAVDAWLDVVQGTSLTKTATTGRKELPENAKSGTDDPHVPRTDDPLNGESANQQIEYTEITSRNYKTENTLLTTTEKPGKPKKQKGSSEAKAPFLESECSVEELAEADAWMDYTLNLLKGLAPEMTPTDKLRRACVGKSEIEIQMALMAWNEAWHDCKVKVNQSYVEAAISGRWVPSQPFVYKPGLFTAEQIAYAQQRWNEQRTEQSRYYDTLDLANQLEAGPVRAGIEQA